MTAAWSSKRPAADDVDRFTYDPMDPVVSYGGNVCCIGGAIDAGSFDQQEIEASREDILVYTTEPFEEGVEVSGTIGITLYVSSDARDTDFTVKLLDVYPDGSAYNLDETIQRVRYREGYDRQVFMEAGRGLRGGGEPHVHLQLLRRRATASASKCPARTSPGSPGT